MANAVSEPDEHTKPTTSIELNSDTESDIPAQELTISDDPGEGKGNLFFRGAVGVDFGLKGEDSEGDGSDDEEAEEDEEVQMTLERYYMI